MVNLPIFALKVCKKSGICKKENFFKKTIDKSERK